MDNEKKFTQEEVNQIVSKRLAEEKAKFSEILQEKEAAMTAKIKEAEALAAAAQIQERNNKQAGVLLEALNKFHAVNPPEISKLLKDNVFTDDAGNVLFKGSNGEAVPVEKGVEEYLKTNAWAVRDMQFPGSGGGVNLSRHYQNCDRNPHATNPDLRGAMGLKE